MINLKVDIGSKSYPLFIGNDILARLSEMCQLYGYKSRAMLITDEKLELSSYFKSVLDNFEKIKVEVIPVIIKNALPAVDGLSRVQQVIDQLDKHRFKATETIIALGGTYIGNISAFIAKMVYGGVSYVQIPSTLSAQIFQCMNPTCYLNSRSIFNFYSLGCTRNLVWNDVKLLESLPVKNIINGLGYIIQSACLLNNGLFEFLEKYLTEIFKLNLKIVEETVVKGCQSRLDAFKQYRTGQKNPRLSNFGEFLATLVHESTPEGINPGAALLIGMFVEAIVAFRQGIFAGPHFERFYQLLKQIPLQPLIDPDEPAQWIKSFKNILSHHRLLCLRLPQQFGQFTAGTECKESDLISALELIWSN